jgi:hypothetical protein
MSVLTGVATIAKTKAAVGLAVAALATGTAAVAAAPSSQSNADGSQQTNAQAFGHKVVGEVATCKGALTSGQHGIGKCVSAWVKSHNPGAEHRAAAGGNAPAKGTEGTSNSNGAGASPSHSPATQGQTGSSPAPAPATTHGQSGTHGKP